ncbi:hypothetical protein I316_02669 [Kwoniella heveanensis BCC8398]|uniref:Uncharacterized protein n=1 Tax=Kwoniella heveanensis BCC8398 TaxID=1296120 RepID=A0A1B9GX58_9TREE|nr:hypothetical protein I316_02669 [Kwoniella heveanensis BCC8398]
MSSSTKTNPTATLSRSSVSSDIAHLLHLQSASPALLSGLLTEVSSLHNGQVTIPANPALSPSTSVDPAEVLKSFSLATEDSTPSQNSNSISSTNPNANERSDSSQHEQSQRLVKAYISSMSTAKHLQSSGEVEVVGQRIDALREDGEGISNVLGEIRV